VPVKKSVSGLPDFNYDRDGNERPRNESGQFITASENELRQQWEKEGGYEANAARVRAVEETILSLSENPETLQNHVATRPH
jgi:hypothetical protein